MSDFEKAGRQHIMNQIELLEGAKPGWDPTFYHTLSYEGDLEAARRLREKYNLPKDGK